MAFDDHDGLRKTHVVPIEVPYILHVYISWLNGDGHVMCWCHERGRHSSQESDMWHTICHDYTQVTIPAVVAGVLMATVSRCSSTTGLQIWVPLPNVSRCWVYVSRCSVHHICHTLLVLTTSSHFNPKCAGTELIRFNIVNIMVVCALAPCVARTSAPHDIDYVEYVLCCLAWGQISATCVMLLWRSDKKCKYILCSLSKIKHVKG